MENEFTKALEAAGHPHPFLFVTVSGAHMYGFPSRDSDLDFRGAHIHPLEDCFKLEGVKETVEISKIIDGCEVDLVTHEIKKFFGLLLKRNGYVLEQLYSPLVVVTSDEHNELKEIAKGCITKYHGHHYTGFGKNQWKLFEKDDPKRIKPLLYVYRVLLTGIHLMRTGEINANIIELNEIFKLSHVDELVAMKLSGEEKGSSSELDVEFHRTEYEKLQGILLESMNISPLPEEPSARDKLNDLLLRIRLSSAP